MRLSVLGLSFLFTMSSHTDMEAKIARLEALLKIQREESASRISELEQRVTNLKLEQHLSAGKPKDPAPQLTAPTGSSDPVLRAEISQLQQVIATKDAEIASKDAEIVSKDAKIERLYRKHSDLSKSMMSYKYSLNTIAWDMDRTMEAAAAETNDLPPENLTPKIEVTDTGRSSKPASSLPLEDVKDEGEKKPKTTSSNASPKDVNREGETKLKTPSSSSPSKDVKTNVPGHAAPAPPEPAKPNYSQVLQAPKPGPVFPKGTVPPVTARGDFFGRGIGQQQAVFNPFKQQQSVQRDRSPKHEIQKGRADQTDVDLSIATSKLQIGEEVPGKTYTNRVSPEVALYAATTPGLFLDNQGSPWDANMIKFNIRVGGSVPPEVMAAYESGALRVPQKEASSISWGNPTPKSVDPLAPKPETGDSSLINASSPDVKKRLADEERPGTRVPVKRLRSM